jgi:hypothetical protein
MRFWKVEDDVPLCIASSKQTISRCADKYGWQGICALGWCFNALIQGTD